jgi:hypothetical protein
MLIVIKNPMVTMAWCFDLSVSRWIEIVAQNFSIILRLSLRLPGDFNCDLVSLMDPMFPRQLTMGKLLTAVQDRLVIY